MNMNIPDKIIEIIEMIPVADRGFVYCAVVNYMSHGTDPDFEMSGTARGIFELVKINLDPILKRRRRDAANRLRKKQLAALAKRESVAGTGFQPAKPVKCARASTVSPTGMAPISSPLIYAPASQTPSSYPCMFTQSEIREIKRKQKKKGATAGAERLENLGSMFIPR